MSITDNFGNPKGLLGRMMLVSMDREHLLMAQWALKQIRIPDSGKVADLGCGAGRNAGELLKKYPQAKVTAMDYSALSVQKAKEYNQAMIDAGRCRVIKGDVSKLPLEADSFELVTAFETIYFWPGLEKCFSQVAGILKDGGYFLICNESDGTDKTSKKFESIIDGMRCYTPAEITAALKSAGFKSVKSDHHPSKPWITVIARK